VSLSLPLSFAYSCACEHAHAISLSLSLSVFSCPLALALSLSEFCTPSDIRKVCFSLSPSLPCSHAREFARERALSLSLSLFLCRPYSLCEVWLSLSHTFTHSLTHFVKNIRARTCALSRAPSLSLSRTRTHTHAHTHTNVYKGVDKTS